MSTSLRSKQIILLAALGLIILVVGLDAVGMAIKAPLGLFSYQTEKATRRLFEAREKGMAAAKRADHFEALNMLGTYLRRPEHHKDIEALYHYAVARREVPEANGKNIGEALRLFKALLERDPNHKEARKDLLVLYGRVGYNTEAIALADKILRDDAKDHEALRYKAVALGRMRKFDEAIKMTDEVLALDPDNVPAMMMRIESMASLDKPHAEILKFAEELHAKHLDDPRYEVVLGYAYNITQDRVKARDILKKAAGRELNDANFIQLLVFQLDGVAQFEDSLSLLRRTGEKTGDPLLMRLLVRRLWESSRFQEMVDLLDKVDLKALKTHSELLAFKAMGLVGLVKDSDQVKEIVELLGKRNDASARAWRPVLVDVVGANAEARKVVATCKLGLTADPSNPYLRYFLAEAYNQMGEQELALEQWKLAARGAPTWAMPYVRMAQGLTATGRARTGVDMARQAVLRAPTNAAALATFANALSAALEGTNNPSEVAVAQLRELLEKVQAASPGEINTLPLWIDTLGREGKTDPAKKQQAVAALRALLDKAKAGGKSATPPESVMVRLATISREHGLFLEKECFELTEQVWGMTPTLAYALSAYKKTYESPEAGKAFLAAELAKENRAQELTWQLQMAQYLAIINDPEGKSMWIDLADKHPDHVAVQRRVMTVPMVQDDRAFMDRVIKRVQASSGEDAMSWKLARARWLLTSEDPKKDASAAVVILNDIIKVSPDLIEPRLLLAAAMQRVENTGGAVEQLNAAMNLQPDNLNVIIALARLRLSQGDFAETRRLIERIATDVDVNEGQLRQIASMQTQMGDLDKSLQTMTKITGDATGKEAPADLMLAELYFRTNQPQKAEPVFRKLMESPNEVVVQAYANFLAAIGRVNDARAVLAKLEGMKMEPGLKEMIHAEFARRFDKPDVAIGHYESAIKLVPKKPVPYLNLMTYLVDLGQVEPMLKLNDMAIKEIPEHKVFALVNANKEVIQGLASRPQLHRMVASIINDNEHRETAAEALRIVHEAIKNREKTAQTLIRLRSILDKSSRFLALHVMMVDLYAAAGRYDEATALATRTMTTFPTSAEPAEQATRVMAAQRKWEETLSTAQKWRERSLIRPLAPDVAIAEAHLNLGNVAKSLEVIEPYRADAMKNPNEFFGVVSIFCRSLAASGKYDEAANILKPVLESNQLWRAVWIGTAMGWIRDQAVAAQWLARVEPTIPKDAQLEFIDLAENWYRLGVRTKNDEHKKKGLDIIRAVAQRPDADAGASARYGIIAYQEGDLITAEAQYRKALEKNPKMPAALNNLAMLLVDRNEKLDEAVDLAKRCVEAEPNVATYYDTLATIQSKRKDFAGAVDSLRQALQIDPASIEWRVNLAGVHLANNNRDESLRVVREIDALDPNWEKLGADLQKRFRAVKDTLAVKAAAAPSP